jgi:hypothetical protein
MRFNYELRQLFLVPYLKQFKAVVLRGGREDYVQFDPYNADGLHFMRSGITHFGSHTGYDHGSEAGILAASRVNKDGVMKESDAIFA